MSNDDPMNIKIFDLYSSHFSGVGSKTESGTILGSNSDIGILFCIGNGHELKRNRCDNNIYLSE